ncbi:MAG: hypothetical protein IJD22_04615 [Clostridia bacterium]|nr:hypothetical protein [Clostridia bacterium]
MIKSLTEFAKEHRTLFEKICDVVEEFISDALTDVLTDGSVVAALARIKQEDKSLWQTIKNAIADFLKRWGEILGTYKGRQLDAQESRALSAMEDVFKNVQQMYAEAFAEANESIAQGEAAETKKAAEGGVKLQEKKIKYSYENLTSDAYYKNGRIYDYDFLINQAPMQIITDMPRLSEVKSNGRIDPDHIAELGLSNTEKYGGIKEGDVYLLENRYTKRTLQISKDSITHGLGGGYSLFAIRTNARLGSIIGEICQNAIPINGLANTHNVKGTYTMVSLIQTKVKENSEWLVARVTVEQQNGKVLGIEALDVTHAVSGIFTSIKDGDITKTAESSASQGPHSGDYVERAHKLSADISIADLLKIVNRTHQEFLSDDVIAKLGTERAKEKKGLFSQRNTRDSEGRKLSEGQMEYFAESVVRDKRGRLLPVYHGTKSAGFNVFSKSDDIGYFFAKSRKTAETYSGTKKIYAPDRSSPCLT